MSYTGYPYEIAIEVAFRDIDAMGMVNNAVFFSYMETARLKYLTEVFDYGDLLDLPLILVEASCSYKSPALLGEILRLGIGVSHMGNKSFGLVYRVLGGDGRVVATGKTIQVMYDYATNSAFPIPNETKAQVKHFQQDWQPPAV